MRKIMNFSSFFLAPSEIHCTELTLLIAPILLTWSSHHKCADSFSYTTVLQFVGVTNKRNNTEYKISKCILLAKTQQMGTKLKM